MSLSTSPEINAYYLDSQFGPSGLTVTHQSAGSTGTGCRGTWQTDIKLNGERGSTSHVELQTLLPDTLDYDLQKGVQKPFAPVTRAVKRLRTRDAWPEVDHWPMIERGLLCLARANVSISRDNINAPADAPMKGLRHDRRRSHAWLVPKSRAKRYVYRHGILHSRQPTRLAAQLAAAGRILGA